MGTPTSLDHVNRTLRIHSSFNGYSHYVKEGGTHVIEKNIGQGSKVYVEFNESSILYDYLDYEHGNICSFAGPIDQETYSELIKLEDELSNLDKSLENVANEALNCDAHGTHIFESINQNHEIVKIVHPDQLDAEKRPPISKFEKFIIRALVLLILVGGAILLFALAAGAIAWFSNTIIKLCR